MTLDELNQIIEDTVDRRFQVWSRPEEKRSVFEILDFIEKHRIIPPPGSKSALEMLREDRDA
ncbi:MAG: hypothetical protein H6672_21055 [Anaerolineaceae bacterium]|nr:hypothetical protein [Anaerolineaceae bacterium]